MQRRQLLALTLPLGAAALLSSCGFALRKAPDFSFKSIFLKAPGGSRLIVDLRRDLEATTPLRVSPSDVVDAKGYEVIFNLTNESIQRRVITYSASGQVRELQLSLVVSFSASTPDGTELIENAELTRSNDISYSETAALSKEGEEDLLLRNMRQELVRQIEQRLAAIQMPAGGTKP